MNVSRNRLVPNITLREAFDEDFKSLNSDAQYILNRLLPKHQRNSDVVEISTCFYSAFMRWLSKFLGNLHLELNFDNLERYKLGKSEISNICKLDESSGDLSKSDSSYGLSDSSSCLNRLEVIDPIFNETEGYKDSIDNETGDPIIIVPVGDDDDDDINEDDVTMEL